MKDHIHNLITEAREMRGYHDLRQREALEDPARIFHATKYHYYDGQIVALERCLRASEELS